MLSLAIVCKSFAVVVSRFDDNFWSCVASEVMGFKPLLCTKHQLLKMLHVRNNILNCRFSTSRVAALIPTPYPLRYYTTSIYNNFAVFSGKTANLPQDSSFVEEPAGQFIYNHAIDKYTTNISSVVQDKQNNQMFAKLFDGRTVKIPFCEPPGQNLTLVGDIIVFDSLHAHFDTSTSSNTLSYWRKPVKILGPVEEWNLFGYFPEGACFEVENCGLE